MKEAIQKRSGNPVGTKFILESLCPCLWLVADFLPIWKYFLINSRPTLLLSSNSPHFPQQAMQGTFTVIKNISRSLKEELDSWLCIDLGLAHCAPNFAGWWWWCVVCLWADKRHGITMRSASSIKYCLLSAWDCVLTALKVCAVDPGISSWGYRWIKYYITSCILFAQ